MAVTPRLLVLPLLVALQGCFGATTRNPTLRTVSDLADLAPENGRFIKVHTAEGELYVLDSWSDPSPDGGFSGKGWRYDVNRDPVEQGSWSFEAADIALLESNERAVAARFGKSGLVTYSVLMGALTITCLADPKTCFGSCPTFYGEDDDRPLAEGFSRSFARALEERDVDDLGVVAEPGPFSLMMRNEALETHAVRHARLAAVPVRAGERVVVGPTGDFHIATGVEGPVSCASEGGDCLALVLHKDDVEYAPPTDGEDLAAPELVGSMGGEVIAAKSWSRCAERDPATAPACAQPARQMISISRSVRV